MGGGGGGGGRGVTAHCFRLEEVIQQRTKPLNLRLKISWFEIGAALGNPAEPLTKTSKEYPTPPYQGSRYRMQFTGTFQSWPSLCNAMSPSLLIRVSLPQRMTT